MVDDEHDKLVEGKKLSVKVLYSDCVVPSKRKTRRRRVYSGHTHADKSGNADRRESKVAEDGELPLSRSLTEDETRMLQAKLQDKVDSDCLEALGHEGGAVLLGEGEPTGKVLPEDNSTPENSAPSGRKPRALFLKQCALEARHMVQALLAFGVLNAVVMQDVVMAPGEFRQLATELGCHRKLQAFCMNWTRMGREEVQELGSALQTNTTLSALDITQCSLGVDGAVVLSSCLAANLGLTSLDISNNNIGAKGTTSIFEALVHNPRISTVCTSHNKMGPEGARLVAPLLQKNYGLTSLHFAGNMLRDAGVAALAQALCATGVVRKINLAQNLITNMGACSLASHLPTSCDTLSLGRNSIGAKGVAALAATIERGCGLSHLDMSYNKVDAKSTPLIARAIMSARARLSTLILRGNSIGDEGTTGLSPAIATGRVQRLDLNSTSITAQGAAMLGSVLCQDACRLQHLDLGWNALGDGGAAFLAAALAGGLVSTLRTLTLNKNGVTGAGLFVLVRSLSANTSLQRLLMTSNAATQVEQEVLRGMTCGQAHVSLEQDKVLAFMMSSHARLGQRSLATDLDDALCRWIVELSVTVCDRVVTL